MLRVLCATTLALGAVVFISSAAPAQQIGEVCRSGQHATVTTPVNIRVSLICKKIGNVWRFVNENGNLHLATYTNTVAQSGKPYRMFLPVLGGRPPYLCNLAPGSALPAGFNFAHAGTVINGVWNCVIASGSVPALPSGTTKRVTPPFTMIMSDASSPIQRASVTLQITIIAAGPRVIVNGAATCPVNKYCEVPLATGEGGIEPYTFRLDTLLAGAPPMGMTFSPKGILSGTPTVEGTTILGVCVVDATGAYDCAAAQVQVTPAAVPQNQGPQLSDLNGTYSANYDPTYQFDDVTVVGKLTPFTYTINNGQVTGGATGQITWGAGQGNARVSVPLTFGNDPANCSGVWLWDVDANHKVTLTANLHCGGQYVYNDGTVTATKN